MNAQARHEKRLDEIEQEWEAMSPPKKNKDYTVTITRIGLSGWQVFAANDKEGFVFAVRHFKNPVSAKAFARYWAKRLSCAIEP